jgi:OOP family OmpA-OmpF porin
LGFYNLEKSMERNVRISFLRAFNAVTWCPFAARALDLTPDSTRYAFRQFAEMTRATAAVIFGAMLFPAFTLAGEPYVGAAAGYSFASLHDSDIVYNGMNTSLGGPVRGESYRLFVGYSFCPYVALESGWFNAGNLSGTIGGFPISSTQTFDGGHRKVKVRGVSLDVVGTLPISGNLSGFARAGVLALHVANDSSYSATVTYPSDIQFGYEFFPIPRRANRFEFGLGVQYKVSSRWSLQSQWQRVNMSAFRMSYLDTLEIAAVYTF